MHWHRNPDNTAVWFGEAAGVIRGIEGAGELVERIAGEAEALLGGATARLRTAIAGSIDPRLSSPPCGSAAITVTPYSYPGARTKIRRATPPCGSARQCSKWQRQTMSGDRVSRSPLIHIKSLSIPKPLRRHKPADLTLDQLGELERGSVFQPSTDDLYADR